MQNFRRLCTCRMKFIRLPVLPRPLETFHSADEKRPRITFTKYMGDPPRFRGGCLILPLFAKNVEYNFMAYFFFNNDARRLSLVERRDETTRMKRKEKVYLKEEIRITEMQREKGR